MKNSRYLTTTTTTTTAKEPLRRTVTFEDVVTYDDRIQLSIAVCTIAIRNSSYEFGMKFLEKNIVGWRRQIWA